MGKSENVSCPPVHGLSGFSAIKQTESPCTGVHIFTFAPESPSNLASVPISSNFDFPAEISYSRGLFGAECTKYST
jgi:hypothetical protein